MHDDDIDAHRLHQHDILGEIARRFRVAHCMAAIFYDKGLARITLHIRQRFDKSFGLRQQGGFGVMLVAHGRALIGYLRGDKGAWSRRGGRTIPFPARERRFDMAANVGNVATHARRTG